MKEEEEREDFKKKGKWKQNVKTEVESYSCYLPQCLGGGGERRGSQGSHLPFFTTVSQSVPTKHDMNIPKP